MSTAWRAPSLQARSRGQKAIEQSEGQTAIGWHHCALPAITGGDHGQQGVGMYVAGVTLGPAHIKLLPQDADNMNSDITVSKLH